MNIDLENCCTFCVRTMSLIGLVLEVWPYSLKVESSIPCLRISYYGSGSRNANIKVSEWNAKKERGGGKEKRETKIRLLSLFMRSHLTRKHLTLSSQWRIMVDIKKAQNGGFRV